MATTYDIEYTQFDTWPPTPITLEAPPEGEPDGALEPIDLTAAEAVFLFIAMDDAPKVEGKTPIIKTSALAFIDKPNGKVAYTPENPAGEEPADLAVSGVGKVKVGIKWSSTKTQQIPKQGYYSIHVDASLS